MAEQNNCQEYKETCPSSSMDSGKSSPVDVNAVDCTEEGSDSLNHNTSTQAKEIEEPGAVGVEGAIDRLLQRQKNELMYELRRLQHGDRPVTGQGHKEAVQELFDRARGAEGPAPEEHRPEHVVVEVNALVERRPVSSALQSGRFRQNLENALRGALSNLSQQPIVRSRNPHFTQVPNVSVQSATTREVDAARSNTSSPIPTPHETLRSTLEHRRNYIEGRPVPAPRHSRSAQPQTPPQEPAQNTEANSGSVHMRRETQNAFAEEWLRREEQDHFNAGSPVHVWQTIEEAQRENFIADVSELVHRQLVTSTLSGNFRHRLESRMQERLEASDTDGRRVQEFLRSVPRTHMHVRNDFSDLGIQEPFHEALSDAMSVVSATAAVAVPYAQSNTALSREMHSLKAQLKEMKNMMKLQFDLSMDLQRSIRQEVSAAMNHSPGIQIQPTVASRPVNDTHCLICLDAMVDTVLYQCGHMCVCHGCGINLRQRGSNCPVCRAPIKDIIRAYKCNSE